MDDLDRFVSLPAAAERLCIHPETARRLVRQGRFPVPVRSIGGKRVVSLRLLVEHIERADVA